MAGAPRLVSQKKRKGEVICRRGRRREAACLNRINYENVDPRPKVFKWVKRNFDMGAHSEVGLFCGKAILQESSGVPGG